MVGRAKMKRKSREVDMDFFRAFHLGLTMVLWSTRNHPLWLECSPFFKKEVPWSSRHAFWEGFLTQRTPFPTHSAPFDHPL